MAMAALAADCAQDIRGTEAATGRKTVRAATATRGRAEANEQQDSG